MSSRQGSPNGIWIVIEKARHRIPSERVNWDRPDEPALYYSEAVVERAVQFLEDLVVASIDAGDPIDVPCIHPSTRGDVKLEWIQEGYRFPVRVPQTWRVPWWSPASAGTPGHTSVGTSGTVGQMKSLGWCSASGVEPEVLEQRRSPTGDLPRMECGCSWSSAAVWCA